ncbi:MAG: AGE family epimerase/isomerase, partial [Ignavibacteriaceae bacterium]|nr:AGE family epimerase/isomerase [Ignavibacteriaceae bacterium]
YLKHMKQIYELIEYRKKFSTELHDDILSYWIKYGVEKGGHGFYGAVDLDGNPVPSANKTSVLNARILWTFSNAAILFGNQEYIEIADKAYLVVTEDFADKQFGGYFMELSSDNKVTNDIKHTYAQAFVIYSLCKYYEFRKLDSTLMTIKDFFFLFEGKAKDMDNPGYMESFTRNWNLYKENRMADNNEPKSMNTHLHVLEAYAALYKIWRDEKVKVRLTELMDLFLNKIIRNDGHFGIFFDNEFNESEASKGICSFGHDIEGSWLLWEAAEVLGDQRIIDKMKPMAIKMVNETDRVAVDKDGGLFLESYRFGSHVRTNKHWWLQAETLVGFMNAFQLTGNLHYWETVKLSWNFIDTCVIDHERGEWYTKVNRLGVPYLIEPQNDSSPYYRNDWKIDPWKCPYHNGRAMMELITRIDQVIDKNNH